MKTNGYFISNEDLDELEEVVMRLSHFLAIVHEQKIETPSGEEPPVRNPPTRQAILF